MHQIMQGVWSCDLVGRRGGELSTNVSSLVGVIIGSFWQCWSKDVRVKAVPLESEE